MYPSAKTAKSTDHKHGFWRNGKFYEVPKKLEELPLPLRQKALAIVFDIDTHASRLQRLTKLVMGVYFNCVTRPVFHVTNGYEFSDYTLLFERMLLPEGQQLLSNPYPRLLGYKGPADKLKNISLIEWIKAENQRQLYFKTLDYSHLHQLAAILYRPRKNAIMRFFERAELFGHSPTGDARKRYTDTDVSHRTARLSEQPMYVHLSLMWFYNCARQHLFDTHQDVFPKSGSENARPYSVRLWLDELNAIAADKGISPDEVAHWRLLTILQIMKQKYVRR